MPPRSRRTQEDDASLARLAELSEDARTAPLKRDQLIAALSKSGYTQSELALAAGFSQPRIHQLLTNERAKGQP